MKNRAAWIISVVAVLVLLLAGVYLLQGSRTPLGQPAIVEMNSQALSDLQAEFNRTSPSLRIILLLSPT